MKFQELLFDNQDKTQFDDMLSQILSELDLMVGSEIDEFGWFLTDYFDDPEEFSDNIEVFTKDDIIRMLNTLAKDENSDEIFSDILYGLEFVEVDDLEDDLEESEHTDLNFENNKIYLNGKLIFDIDTYVKNTDIETIAKDFNSFAISNKWGSDVAEVTDDDTIFIDREWFDSDDAEVTEDQFREYAKQSLILIIDYAVSNLDTSEENLQNFFDCFVHDIKLNETPSINPANKPTQKAKFKKRINRAWNAHSKSYNKAHAVKNRVERIASGTARKQKRYGKVYKRRLSLARKNRSNLTKRKARFSRIRPRSGFGTAQAKQNLKH